MKLAESDQNTTGVADKGLTRTDAGFWASPLNLRIRWVLGSQSQAGDTHRHPLGEGLCSMQVWGD